MRQHFHRCPNLRVLTVEAREIDATRGPSHVVLDELCAARKLASCVGLVECEILDASQKRELLAVRVTRLRAEEGARHSTLGDVPDPRWDELAALAEELREERRAIQEENRRLLAEAGAAAGPPPVPALQEPDRRRVPARSAGRPRLRAVRRAGHAARARGTALAHVTPRQSRQTGARVSR